MTNKKYARKFKYRYLTILTIGIFGLGSVIYGLSGSLDVSFFQDDPQSADVIDGDSNVAQIGNIFKSSVRKTVKPYSNILDSISKSLPRPQFVQVSAKAYYIAPIKTPSNDNLVAFSETIEHNSEEVLPIASVTKLVTAVVATNLLATSTTVYITPTALATEGFSGHFKNGQEFTVREMLYPLLMESSNDAAEALAQAYGRDRFIAAMNLWVKSIGAKNTRFEDASGLSPNNVSTAKDLHLIMQWIYNNRPDLIGVTTTKVFKARRMTWTNPTHFLNISSYLGGKNGFTDEAGRTNVSMFNIKKNNQNVPYIIVLLKTANRDRDTLAILKYLESSK